MENNLKPNELPNPVEFMKLGEDAFISKKIGIKYQQEISYSEEDMKLSFEAGKKRGNSGYPNTDNFKQPNFEEFIEQFKNK